MKMKKKALIMAPIALCLLGSLVLVNGSCYYVYRIEGHDGDSRGNPPDIRMTVGEEQVAVRANLALRTAVRLGSAWRIGVPSMSSSDASVVEVHQPSKETITLRAKSPGRALLKYHPCPVEPNRSFWVVVEEADSNEPEAGDARQPRLTRDVLP